MVASDGDRKPRAHDLTGRRSAAELKYIGHIATEIVSWANAALEANTT